MSTTSLERPTTDRRDSQGAGRMPPAGAKPLGTGEGLYRVIWRWHFYAGMIIAPVLIVVTVTGALYIFKDELEGVMHPGVTYVEPGTERVSYEQQVAAVRAAAPPSFRIAQMQIFADPRRATSMAIFGDKFQYSFVDPYRGDYLGAIEAGGFFDIVLKLHRTVFVGSTGRIVVELTTCWTIALVATGVYLWWPRRANQLWGVWLPRLRRKPYVILRDLHTISGIYLAAIAVVICLTGMIYTYVWGGGFQYAALKTDAYEMFTHPMLSKSPSEAKDVSIDRIVDIAREKMPGSTLTVWFPRAPNAVYLVCASSNRGPSVLEMLFIDRASGEILEHRYNSQNNPLYQISTWNYPLHVGSIFGLPSKWLWLAACIVLVTSPLTGIWMWWERRPRGRLGLPRRVKVRLPRWLVITILAFCVLLPAFGLSVVALIVGEQVFVRLARLRPQLGN